MFRAVKLAFDSHKLLIRHVLTSCNVNDDSRGYMIKSGNFGHQIIRTATLFVSYANYLNIFLTKRTVKILIRRHSDVFHCLQMYVQIYMMSEFT